MDERKRKQTVMKFNHISKDLTPERIQELSNMFLFYHRLATCYRWMYKRLKRKKMSLNMSSIGLTSVGVIVGGVTLNPIILGVVSGAGVMIQGYSTLSNISRKVDQCKFAYTSYDKILIQLRGFIRGMSYDDSVFLSDIKVLDDIAEDMCPPISEKMLRKYDKYYKIEKRGLKT